MYAAADRFAGNQDGARKHIIEALEVGFFCGLKVISRRPNISSCIIPNNLARLMLETQLEDRMTTDSKNANRFQ